MQTPQTYEIRVRGHLGESWSAWFEDMDVSYEETDTLLRGSLMDQAALHGVLAKIRDLGLTLVEVRQISDLDRS